MRKFRKKRMYDLGAKLASYKVIHNMNVEIDLKYLAKNARWIRDFFAGDYLNLYYAKDYGNHYYDLVILERKYREYDALPVPIFEKMLEVTHGLKLPWDEYEENFVEPYSFLGVDIVEQCSFSAGEGEIIIDAVEEEPHLNRLLDALGLQYNLIERHEYSFNGEYFNIS